MLDTLFVFRQDLVENMTFPLYCKAERLDKGGEEANYNA